MANTTSTTSFKADISQLKSAMQQAQKQVSLANSEFKKATAGLDNWSQSAVGLSAKLKQLDSVLSAQKQKLSLMEQEYQKVVKVYGENSAAATKLKTDMNNQQAAIAKTEKEIGKYSDELKKAEKYGDNFDDTLEDMNDSADQASDGFTVMKGALADLIADGIKMAVSAMKELIESTIEVGRTFEKSMASVQALSGATQEEMELLTETAKHFGETTQFSASEAADALGYMALAGWDAQTSAAALGGVLDLAAASNMDLAEASDMVTDYMSAFGMKAEESAYFADLLAYAQANANTSAQGLGEAFRNSAANMNAAGQDIETTVSLLSMMANQGLKGAKAGTALTAVMRDITNKMDEGAIAIGQTNVQVMDADGNFRDLTDILMDVEKATSGMGDAQKASALSATFTADSIKGLNLILNAGVGEAASFEQQLRNSSGAASEMAKIMNDNLSGDLTALNSKIEGTKIKVYESLTPALRDAVAQISNVIDSIDWDKVGVKLGNVTKKAVEFFKGVIENAEGIISVLRSVATVIGTAFVVDKVASFGKGILLLVKQINAFKNATNAATAAQKLFNIAQAAAPIAIVTAAVAGLVTGLLYLAQRNKEATVETEALTEAQLEDVDAINKTAEALSEMRARRDENVSAIQAEYEHYGDLVDELDSLVDANGFVKAGYEDRVNFILTTLNDAIGTEMELIDGVIVNYQEERQAIEDLIEAKKAQAILNANEEAYTEAIQNQKKVFTELITIENDYKEAVDASKKATEERVRIQNMSADEYAKSLGIMTDAGMANEMYQEKLAETIAVEKQQKAAVGELRVALGDAEQNYASYNATIENYEGLASAIISKDSEKIHEALQNEINDFISAESGTEESLQRQVYTMQANYEELKKAVENGSTEVTQEMVNDAKSMVDQAQSELDKFKGKANKSGSEGVSNYAKGMSSNSTAMIQTAKGLRDNAEAAFKPTGSATRSGYEVSEGFADGIYSGAGEVESASDYVAEESIDTFDSTLEVNSPSRRTYQSGIYFAQGFMNGLSSQQQAVFNKAYNMARAAVDAVKKAQKEGSPSKLTYQSGVYFVQGYINGIMSESKSLDKTVTSLVKSAYKTLSKMSRYNFETVAETASTKFASGMQEKLNYALNKMQFQNEKKLKEFDNEIKKLQEEQAAEAEKLNEASTIKKEKLQEESDKRLEALQERYDAEENKDRKKQIKTQIDAEKKYAKDLIKAEENTTKQLVKESSERYSKLIETQENYKDAYSKASSQMISEYTDAMNAYQQKAQDLIDSTINGITDKYTARYDELISKQDSLVEKMKSAGDLFTISGAGVMTINNLKQQTKDIKNYTKQLAVIKKRVSAELFDEIASMDMKEGNAYISQLLKLSESDLAAYNDAYSKKLQAANYAGKKIYKKDFEQLNHDYRKEVKEAFKGLDEELEKMGTQAMRGFLKGLTTDTNYMDKEVKVFVHALVDSFKKELQIKSPSKVMEKIGGFTGAGLVEGLTDKLNDVKRAASSLASAVSTPLDSIKTDITGAVASVNGSAETGAMSRSVVNNYNLVQNNNSPKSLSALDTYQARRQQIAMIKAFT